MKKVNLRFPLVKKLFAGVYWYLLPLCFCWPACGLLLLLHYNAGSFNPLNSYQSHARLLYYLAGLSNCVVLVAIFVLILCRSRTVETIIGVCCVFIGWYTCVTIKYNVFANWKKPETVTRSI